ncbi:hypothetical protein GE09DRAFT_28220 [Coniochaeta sp. 2T2.1]|nr:hypothetical protein GE09DRAFT_28220 [Coniochaeta sp. 2T2.1]
MGSTPDEGPHPQGRERITICPLRSSGCRSSFNSGWDFESCREQHHQPDPPPAPGPKLHWTPHESFSPLHLSPSQHWPRGAREAPKNDSHGVVLRSFSESTQRHAPDHNHNLPAPNPVTMPDQNPLSWLPRLDLVNLMARLMTAMAARLRIILRVLGLQRRRLSLDPPSEATPSSTPPSAPSDLPAPGPSSSLASGASFSTATSRGVSSGGSSSERRSYSTFSSSDSSGRPLSDEFSGSTIVGRASSSSTAPSSISSASNTSTSPEPDGASSYSSQGGNIGNPDQSEGLYRNPAAIEYWLEGVPRETPPPDADEEHLAPLHDK